MLISTTNSFANISNLGYLILALFVLIDRTTCLLIKQSVTASSGTHFFFFLVIFLKCAYFPEIDTKMRNLKLKVPNKKVKKSKSTKPTVDFIKVAHFSR